MISVKLCACQVHAAIVTANNRDAKNARRMAGKNGTPAVITAVSNKAVTSNLFRGDIFLSLPSLSFLSFSSPFFFFFCLSPQRSGPSNPAEKCGERC